MPTSRHRWYPSWLLEGIIKEFSTLAGNEAATLLHLIHEAHGYRIALRDQTLHCRLRLHSMNQNLYSPSVHDVDSLFLRLVHQLNRLRARILAEP